MRRVGFLTIGALVGFASNSLLCRAALLDPRAIDPASFTAIRIVSGVLTLAAILIVRSSARDLRHGDWKSAVALFTYAIAFSFAYVRLATGTGALILFAVVQLTMLGFALIGGERASGRLVAGLLLAFAGVVVICAPGIRSPDPAGASLMALAGIAWGIYSLRGRGSSNAIANTAGNFLRASPLALIATLPFLGELKLSAYGVMLAIASGALASGLGYALWYSALPHLSATRASIVQLVVPIIAAVAGVILLDESPTLRLAAAGAMTIGGVWLAISRTRAGSTS